MARRAAVLLNYVLVVVFLKVAVALTPDGFASYEDYASETVAYADSDGDQRLASEAEAEAAAAAAAAASEEFASYVQWAAAEFGVDLTSMDLEGGVEELGSLDSGASSSAGDSSSASSAGDGKVAAADKIPIEEERSADQTDLAAVLQTETANAVLTSGLGAFRKEKPISGGASVKVESVATSPVTEEVPVSKEDAGSATGDIAIHVESEEPAAAAAAVETPPAASANPWTSIFGLSWKKLAEPLAPLKPAQASSEPAVTTARAAAPATSGDAVETAASPPLEPDATAATTLAASPYSSLSAAEVLALATATTAANDTPPPPAQEGGEAAEAEPMDEEQLAQLAAEAEARATAAAAEEAALKEEASRAASRAAASARAAAEAEAASQEAARIAAGTSSDELQQAEDETTAAARAQEAALLEEVNAARIREARASAKHAKAAADAKKLTEPTVKSTPIAQGGEGEVGGGSEEGATNTEDSQAAESPECDSGAYSTCSSSSGSGAGWSQAIVDNNLVELEEAKSAEEEASGTSQNTEAEEEPTALEPDSILPSEGADGNVGASPPSSSSFGSGKNSNTSTGLPLEHCLGLCALAFVIAGVVGWYGGTAAATAARLQADQEKVATWASEKARLLQQNANLEAQSAEAQGRIVVLEQERDEALAAAERARAKQREAEVELMEAREELGEAATRASRSVYSASTVTGTGDHHNYHHNDHSLAATAEEQDQSVVEMSLSEASRNAKTNASGRGSPSNTTKTSASKHSQHGIEDTPPPPPPVASSSSSNAFAKSLGMSVEHLKQAVRSPVSGGNASDGVHSGGGPGSSKRKPIAKLPPLRGENASALDGDFEAEANRARVKNGDDDDDDEEEEESRYNRRPHGSVSSSKGRQSPAPSGAKPSRSASPSDSNVSPGLTMGSGLATAQGGDEDDDEDKGHEGEFKNGAKADSEGELAFKFGGGGVVHDDDDDKKDGAVDAASPLSSSSRHLDQKGGDSNKGPSSSAANARVEAASQSKAEALRRAKRQCDELALVVAQREKEIEDLKHRNTVLESSAEVARWQVQAQAQQVASLTFGLEDAKERYHQLLKEHQKLQEAFKLATGDTTTAAASSSGFTPGNYQSNNNSSSPGFSPHGEPAAGAAAASGTMRLGVSPASSPKGAPNPPASPNGLSEAGFGSLSRSFTFSRSALAESQNKPSSTTRQPQLPAIPGASSSSSSSGKPGGASPEAVATTGGSPIDESRVQAIKQRAASQLYAAATRAEARIEGALRATSPSSQLDSAADADARDE